MAEISVDKSFYPNGLLRWEGYFKDGKLHGKNRHWHEDGQLSNETAFENGLEHGVAAQWDKNGKLLGQYSMNHGTGIERKWFENGQLEREAATVCGRLCGKFNCWFEDGKLVSSGYYIMDKKVSKKKYLEACKNDPNLPQYDEIEPKLKTGPPSTKYQQSKTPVSEARRKEHDSFIAKFRTGTNQVEARQWLADSENRNIGEMTPEASREVIERGYQAGAVKIIAVDVQEDSTNCLIIELPPQGIKRKRVFEWNNKLAQNSGFDRDDDWGQSELFVYFS